MLSEVTVGMVSGLAGALSAAVALWRAVKAPCEALERRVRELEEEKLKSLRGDLDMHVKADRSSVYMAKLESCLEELRRLGAKMDALSEASARQSAQIEADRRYIENLDRSMQRHREKGNGQG